MKTLTALGLLGFTLTSLAAVGCSDGQDADASRDENVSPAPAEREDSDARPAVDAYDPGSGTSAEGLSIGSAGADAPASGGSGGSSGVSLMPAPPTDPIIGPGTGAIAPGTLTAGAWDDNQNLERFLDYRAELYGTGQEPEMPGWLDFTEEDHRAAQAAVQSIGRVRLDVALVIDTTGSMTDELTYLQTEFDALSASIEINYPDAEQRWALVVYKDSGDDYETRTFDFTDDPAAFRVDLAAQRSGGGGDYPEASHAALQAMNQLAWRSDDTTARLAFWVGDAPHHVEQAGTLSAAIVTAQSQNVHLYPVASSGVDELTEISMRSAAQLTGGRYLFLTDDSGVGGAHKEPSIPCYYVTQLDQAILRMVSVEMSGSYQEPAADQIVRASGNPEGGTCTLESGETVFAF